MDTCPLLTSALESILTSWLKSPRRFQLATCTIEPSLVQCIDSQASLGWYHFLCGFHSRAIVKHQHNYFLRKGSRKSAPYWASKLTRVLWNFIHEMWSFRTLAKHSINDLATDAPEVNSLRTAALLELAQGCTALPALYRHYFNNYYYLSPRNVTYRSPHLVSKHSHLSRIYIYLCGRCLFFPWSPPVLGRSWSCSNAL